jgi:hypothetical protein
MVGTYTDTSGERATHWWLRGPNGEIIDPTADQYYAFNETPPYSLGKGCGFSRSNDAPTKSGSEIVRLASIWLKKHAHRSK